MTLPTSPTPTAFIVRKKISLWQMSSFIPATSARRVLLRRWTTLGQCVCEELLDGNRVELAHLGTFSLSLTCGNKKLEDRVTKNDIRVKNILFTPCAEMKHAMQGAEIVSGGPNPNKQLSDEVILRRLAKYFEEHEFMQRRNFESVCECSRYTATKKLKELVKAGKLRAMGAKNVRFYVKGSL